MGELTRTVEINGEKYNVLNESAESRSQAFEGILIASRFADQALTCGDISQEFAFELAEVKKVNGALIHSPLDRHNVANVALRAKESH